MGLAKLSTSSVTFMYLLLNHKKERGANPSLLASNFLQWDYNILFPGMQPLFLCFLFLFSLILYTGAQIFPVPVVVEQIADAVHGAAYHQIVG